MNRKTSKLNLFTNQLIYLKPNSELLVRFEDASLKKSKQFVSTIRSIIFEYTVPLKHGMVLLKKNYKAYYSKAFFQIFNFN